MVDGLNRHFTMPVVTTDDGYLRATKSGDADPLVCEDRWGAGTFTSRFDCIVQAGVSFEELYSATGAFFGDQASLAAIYLRLRLNSPSRNRHGETADGVVVVKALP